MALPDNVLIGDTLYTVARLFEDEDDRDGDFSVRDQVIRLADRVPQPYLKYLLAHEIVHGVFEHSGAATGKPGERYTEEQVACIIGRALPALLRNNPDLVEYLAHG